ncbi:hypothetical protein GOD82_15015 [Sinorhizobium medicae]|uniref:D-alanyl-D-alanine carboxypeptidase family protein n=1 Tax=Sinorhizobium medicae TaxID=110321 RepID=UPI000369E0FC|nr:D-alanyl-D-alanine carboxypeptidase family protein [Sinorhizobium medicae]MDX0831232.1 hypothetical protein [Sinorhizobium medicae]RVI57149.1 hypothetical protein CN192_11630 [Sinorhizobium medicae]UFX00306.1 D-alanyl-D-alanine carboxypeptidase family protein [Sinorhizobium medicae WSM1115]
MATDLESLVLSISADTSQLRRALQRTEQDAKGTANSIERSFANVVPFERMQQGFNRSARAIAADAQNIKFQIGDIATQIGSGTSALQAFSQQAGQLGQAISSGGIRAVGSALAGLLNPLYAIPIAISLAAPVIKSFFEETEKGGKDAAKSIEAQRDLIRQVAQEWGAALPTLAAYNSALEAQEAIAKQIAGVQAGQQKAQTDAATAIEKTSEALGKVLPLFERFPKHAAAVEQLRSSWQSLQDRITAGTATLEEVEALQAQFNSTLAKLPVQSARNLAEEVRSNVIPALREAIGTMERLRTEAAQLATRQETQRLQGRMNLQPFHQELSTVPAELAGKDAASAFVGGAKEKLKELEPEFAAYLDAFMAAAPGKISINSGRRTTERQAELFAAEVKKRGSVAEARKWVAPPGHSMHERGGAADLGYESEAVKRWAHANAEAYGLTFRLKNEDWHIELARADAAKQTAEADRAGAAAIREKGAATSDTTTKTQELTEAEKQRLKATEDAKRAAVDMIDLGLTSFVNELRAGASAADALKAALDDVLSVIIRMAINSVSSGIGQALGIPMRHSGGPVGLGGARRNVNPMVFAGAPRMHSGGVVGLNPGEVPIIAQRGEIVLPKGALKRQTAVNTGGVVNNVTVDVSTGAVTANNQDARALGIQINKAVQAVLVAEQRPGGLLRRA